MRHIGKKFVLAWISGFISLIMVVFAVRSGLVPTKYIISGTFMIVMILLLLILLQHKRSKVRLTIALFIEIVIIAVSCYGISFFYNACHLVENVSQEAVEDESVSGYVMLTNENRDFSDKMIKIGVVTNQSDEAERVALERIKDEQLADFEIVNFSDMFQGADALREDEIQILILNDAFAQLIPEIEGYEWFLGEVVVWKNFLVRPDQAQIAHDTADYTSETRVNDSSLETETRNENTTTALEIPDTADQSTDHADPKPNTMNNYDKVANAQPEPVKDLMEEPEQVDWNSLVSQDLIEVPEGSFIVYISGVDTWGSASARSRSDVNILAVVNTNTKKVLLVSTPRDYYVPLSCSKGVKDKLTHAGIYGVNTSLETLEMLYGIDIQYSIKMNFTGFVNITDSLGGIEVYSDSTFSVGDAFYYTEGINQMNGIQALAFARERHVFAGGDRARGTHQMEVIKAVLSKCASGSILYNYADVMNSISGCFTTNMPKEKIASLVRMQLDDMAQWSISSVSVDGTGAQKTTYTVPQKKAYVMIPDEKSVLNAKTMIMETLGD